MDYDGMNEDCREGRQWMLWYGWMRRRRAARTHGNQLEDFEATKKTIYPKVLLYVPLKVPHFPIPERDNGRLFRRSPINNEGDRRDERERERERERDLFIPSLVVVAGPELAAILSSHSNLQ